MITLATPEEEDAYRYRHGSIPSYVNHVNEPEPVADPEQIPLFMEDHA